LPPHSHILVPHAITLAVKNWIIFKGKGFGGGWLENYCWEFGSWRV
jgi:hypothetical protein